MKIGDTLVCVKQNSGLYVGGEEDNERLIIGEKYKITDIDGRFHNKVCIKLKDLWHNITINDEWVFGSSSIAYIEPGIYEIIKNINSQLAAYDLYISHNDFEPFQESEYELVISKIGTKPVEKKNNF